MRTQLTKIKDFCKLYVRINPEDAIYPVLNIFGTGRIGVPEGSNKTNLMPKIKEYSLYLVISEEYGAGKSAMEIARLAISGKVDIIQMREKNKTRGELVKLACELSRLCKEKRVVFIVNDDPWIAKECDADGVHLGQEDMLKYDINEARNILGKGKIIGASTHSLAQLNSANEKDIDYLAYGPIFPTKTKDYFLGPKDIKEVLKITRKPVFFIGGINLSNLDEILKEGAKNIAVIRCIIQAEDIIGMARSFKDRLMKEKEKGPSPPDGKN